jgi:integrase
LRIRWTPPKAAAAIDPACVVNPDQARALLSAVAKVGDGTREIPVPKARRGSKAPVPVRRKEPQGGPLVAFFGCLYYAGMRPSEALALLDTDLDLPDDDTSWGLLRVARNDPEVTTTWTDNGRRQARQLKHRAQGEVRPVPCCPDLVALLRRHLATYGTGPDGRLFRGARGGTVKESVYTEVWQGARERAFTARQVASPLAARPYDLRHSCVSAWLAAGVEPPKIAAWVGHSVAVLHRVYAHVLPHRDQVAKKRIEDLLTSEVDVSPPPDGAVR